MPQGLFYADSPRWRMPAPPAAHRPRPGDLGPVGNALYALGETLDEIGSKVKTKADQKKMDDLANSMAMSGQIPGVDPATWGGGGLAEAQTRVTFAQGGSLPGKAGNIHAPGAPRKAVDSATGLTAAQLATRKSVAAGQQWQKDKATAAEYDKQMGIVSKATAGRQPDSTAELDAKTREQAGVPASLLEQGTPTYNEGGDQVTINEIPGQNVEPTFFERLKGAFTGAGGPMFGGAGATGVPIKSQVVGPMPAELYHQMLDRKDALDAGVPYKHGKGKDDYASPEDFLRQAAEEDPAIKSAISYMGQFKTAPRVGPAPPGVATGSPVNEPSASAMPSLLQQAQEWLADPANKDDPKRQAVEEQLANLTSQ